MPTRPLDELLPPEPEDEPEEPLEPEPEATPWELEDDAQDPLDEDLDAEEDLLGGEVLEDDRWWAADELAEESEDEGSATPLVDELLPSVTEEEGWGALDEEPEGPTLRVGYEESVLLIEQEYTVKASCDTGAALSRLYGKLLSREGDRAQIDLLGHRFDVPVREEGGVLLVVLRLGLGPLTLDAALPIAPWDGESPLVRLGRDLLAGRVLVDPAHRLLLLQVRS